MTKREQRLLVVAGLVALVGLGNLYFGRAPGPMAPGSPQAPSGNETAKAQSMLGTIRGVALGKTEGALVAAIHADWRTAAFYGRPMGAPQAAASNLPRYTGFVELGSGRLAIVDGLEYQVGDSLEGGGYKVAAIEPDRVVLEIVANGNRVVVPHEGQDEAAR